jgi:hypothetical protein
MIPPEDKSLIIYIFGQILILFSTLGLLLCAAIRFLFYDSYEEFNANPILFALNIVCVSLFAAGFLVPAIGFLYYGRKEREGQKLDKMTFKDLLGLPFGAFNPDAKVPWLIKMPVLGLLYVLIAILALFLLGFTISFILSKFTDG